MESSVDTFIQLGGFIGLLAYIVFQDWRTGRLGGEPAEKKMDRLAGYWNHTTTELLEQIRDDVRSTNTKLDEFEKFGIKPRKE